MGQLLMFPTQVKVYGLADWQGSFDACIPNGSLVSDELLQYVTRVATVARTATVCFWGERTFRKEGDNWRYES